MLNPPDSPEQQETGKTFVAMPYARAFESDVPFLARPWLLMSQRSHHAAMVSELIMSLVIMSSCLTSHCTIAVEDVLPE